MTSRRTDGEWDGGMGTFGVWFGRAVAILLLASISALCIALVVWVWGKVL